MIGALEVVSDQTAVKQAAARARKVAEYQERETETVAQALGKLSRGLLDFNVTVTGGDVDTAEVEKTFQVLAAAVNESAAAVRRLVGDATHLSEAAVQGQLATRADATKHQGDFRKIVEGVNATLDAVVGPLQVASEYVQRIGRGDIPGEIAQRYSGDFEVLRNSLNQCIAGLAGLQERTGSCSGCA